MYRTQLYLDDDMHERLRRMAQIQGTTVSELVRRAIDRTYFAASPPAARARAVAAAAGLWHDRDDLSDERAWLRDLRGSGRRLVEAGVEP